MDLAVSADHRVKLKEKEKKDKYINLAGELKKETWNMKVTFLPVIIDALGTVTERLLKGLGNKKMSGDHPNYCIIEIDQNTKKSPGDLRRLAVTQTSVKDHQHYPQEVK